jgi:hypothetical protein
MPAGYTIRVSARRLNSGESELYQAAIDDENLAKLTVRAFSGASIDALVEAAGDLSQGEIAQLGLEPGQIRSARENNHTNLSEAVAGSASAWPS